MKEIILLFNIPDKGIRNQLRNLFTPLKITTKYVEKTSYGKTLGQLAGVSPDRQAEKLYDGPELDGAMLIFANIPNRTLDIILAKLREFPSMTFPYKAVLTPTNAGWTVTDCFSEIKQEHEIMHTNRKIEHNAEELHG